MNTKQNAQTKSQSKATSPWTEVFQTMPGSSQPNASRAQSNRAEQSRAQEAEAAQPTRDALSVIFNPD